MHFSTFTLATAFLSLLSITVSAPLPKLIGSPCFGSSATGCSLSKRMPIAEPKLIGSPCFGSSATGCALSRSEDISARTPEAVTEPAPAPDAKLIGSPCFGSSATGCALSKKDESVISA